MSEFIQTASTKPEIETRSDLTELPNRRVLERTLKGLIEMGETNISLLSIDLDDLKRINDGFGHLEGDNYIINAARVIEESVRTNDSAPQEADVLVPSVAELYHRSGDEFYVILRNTTNAQTIVERIQHNLDEIEARASIGLAVYEPNDTVSSFQARSEEALIDDKRKRRYSTFTESQRDAVHHADALLAMYGLHVVKVEKIVASA